MQESRPRRLLDIAVNVAIIISAACLLALVIARVRTPHPTTQAQPSLSLGQHLSVNGVQPSSNGSLVFVLQIDCRFCQQSMPFYRSLAPNAATRGRKIVYVMPSTVAASQTYLAQQGLPSGEVVQASLDQAQVSGTPTLILLDNKNDVQNVWAGELDQNGQQQVQNAVADSR